MAFLSDRDILEEIESGNIVCEPFERSNLSCASIDLRLGANIYKQQSYDPVRFDIDRSGKLKTLDAAELTALTLKDKPFLLYPEEFVLAQTLEYVGQTSDRIISELSDKSTLGRLGLSTFFSAGFIDPGNVLNITLELKNNGNMPIELQYGMHICQIRFAYLSSPCLEKYKGKYLGSRIVEVAK